MTFIDDLKTTKQKVWDFIKRHALWIALGVVAFFLLIPTLAELGTIYTVLLYEAMAIALSSIALYSYTNIKFNQTIIKGEDKEMNSVEQHGYYSVIAAVFLGVHLLVGLIVFGTYFVQFSK